MFDITFTVTVMGKIIYKAQLLFVDENTRFIVIKLSPNFAVYCPQLSIMYSCYIILGIAK